MSLLAVALGFLVGLSLGLLGGGGSILTVPILVYVLGFEPKAAIAGSLAVVGLVSLVGAWRHARAGQVEGRTAALFGAVAMVGAYGGARSARLVSGEAQLLLFAVVMLAVAVFMLKGRPPPEEHRASRPGVVAAVALSVGALTGLVGIGGGFLIVPALVLFLDVPMKRAVGTSLLVIFFNAAAGFVGYVGQVTVPWVALAAFGLFAVAGIFAGSHLVHYVSARALRRAFALFLVAVAVWMLAQNLPSVAGT
jgi:uncharacterized protein